MLKVITKDGVELKKLELNEKFVDIEDLRVTLLSVVDCFPAGSISLGYIEPGHGTKGRQINLDSSNDLLLMYKVHEKRKQIVLWMKEEKKLKKRKDSPNCTDIPMKKQCSDSKPKSKYTPQQAKMNELEEIVDRLTESHSKSFTVEQIRVWAHMLQMKKHDSYDAPPKKPFFKQPQKKEDMSLPNGLSPGRKIQYRTQCIDQLDKWHSLLERGAITQAQYTEMQGTILSDLKKY